MVAFDECNESYLIHDNGGRPFEVKILSPEVQVLQIDHEGQTDDEDDDRYTLIHHFSHLRRIVIGKSPLIPMTQFSGGHGPNFDGNTHWYLSESLDAVWFPNAGGPEISTLFTTADSYGEAQATASRQAIEGRRYDYIFPRIVAIISPHGTRFNF